MTETPCSAAGETLTITLPDGLELTLASPTCVAEIVAAIGPGRRRLAVHAEDEARLTRRLADLLVLDGREVMPAGKERLEIACSGGHLRTTFQSGA